MENALSPLDGRYAHAVESLKEFFSEEALNRARLEVEIRYFIFLSRQEGVRGLRVVGARDERALLELIERFSPRDAAAIKDIERTTKHDVKAVEYFLRGKMERLRGLRDSLSFIHFALTSEDVNNLAYGLLIHAALKRVILPAVQGLKLDLQRLANRTQKATMLSLTHGQPATPTTMGKEMMVFVSRLERQNAQLKVFRMQGKLGGAVGNFSAHRIAYPDVDWEGFRKRFVRSLGMVPLAFTTQINPHDDLAELSHVLFRIDTILLDCSRDCWLYISRGVFAQKTVAGEVGSSTMPHKVNPIDFENAEGNLGIANALFGHFAEKLPVSRLQRDLSDSTVQRNIGVAFGYHLLAVTSLRKGLGKLSLNRAILKRELAEHPEVVAEGIQVLLRKHGVADAYEKLKKLTRGEKITKQKLEAFIRGLNLPAAEERRILALL